MAPTYLSDGHGLSGGLSSGSDGKGSGSESTSSDLNRASVVNGLVVNIIRCLNTTGELRK